jgi:D-tyrosyl-tRNA(Tyr) deacylase
MSYELSSISYELPKTEHYMRAVIQRVTQGRVIVDNKPVAEIGLGLVILLGIGPEDTPQIAEQLADKIAFLRIFNDRDDKMNLSIRDVAGEAIVVSQFTLFADTSRGRRPSFVGAGKPDLAEPLVEEFAEFLSARGIPTQTGVFGAHMNVELINDGPVTIVMEL